MKKQLSTLALSFACLVFAESAQSAFIDGALGIDELQPNGGNYLVTFSKPITPLTGLVSWTADVSGTLTDGGREGISLAPYFTPTIYEFLIGGVVVGSDALGILTSNYSASYSGFYDCGAGCSTLGLAMRFTTSGLDDKYQFSARLDVVESDATIPEPGIAVLLLTGLAGLVLMRRIHKRH